MIDIKDINRLTYGRTNEQAVAKYIDDQRRKEVNLE